LRAGKVQLLVATDVVGRGIDVSTISHIINYDLPQDCDDYVHRVGRTGRMGREGIAFSFVTKDEGPQLTDIEWRINRELIRDSFDEPANSLGKIDSEEELPAMEALADGPAASDKAANLVAKRRLNPMRRKLQDRRPRSGRSRG
jgi:ATP-dependent RNA helicase DeaD